ncbi:MAG: hypothetical protein Q6L60_12955 [Thermostichus sp. HHBFW_bins_43]
MLHRRIYQLSREGKDVWIYLRDQGRWLERAKILDIEGDTILVRYETEDEEEICSWEEMVRLESIGAVAQRLSTIPKGMLSTADLPTSEDCPSAELLNLPLLPAEGEDHPNGERLLEDYYLDREASAEMPVRLSGEDLKRLDRATHDPEGHRESNHD